MEINIKAILQDVSKADLLEIIEISALMFQAQKRYFKHKLNADLIKSIELEKMYHNKLKSYSVII